MSIQSATWWSGTCPDIRGASPHPNRSVIVFDVTKGDPTTPGRTGFDAKPVALEAAGRFRSNVATCPSLIRVVHTDSGALVEAEVDIR